MERNFVCILCPRGCRIKVDNEGNITGNHCKRGLGYVQTEMTAPTRVVTSTVKTAFKETPRVSVKTSVPVPKGMIMEVMAEINKVVVDKPMGIGEVIIKNVLDTGSDIILTKSCLK